MDLLFLEFPGNVYRPTKLSIDNQRSVAKVRTFVMNIGFPLQ